jgi:hypothetical protein
MNNVTNRKKIVERRKHKRFQVQEGAFAVLTPHFYKRGQIIDISRGGLAFRYTNNELTPNASSNLGISLADVGFYLSKVPFKTISDFEIANEVAYSFTTIRRCGVEFGDLTLNQISQLEYFIWNHTIGEVRVNCQGARAEPIMARPF